MPRMSLDDRAGRDPRVAHLAKLQGWSLRETRGCLAFEVWPLCYDRATPYLRRLDIELATGSESLAQNMIAAGLATETRHGLRIAGASDRVEYLLRAKAAGHAGGKASGKSRASNEPFKGQRTNPQGSTNPSASASASASDLPSASAPDTAVVQEERERATPAAVASPQLEILKSKVDAVAGEVGARRARKGKPSDPTAAECEAVRDVLAKLGGYNGVAYSGAKAHTKLIVDRLRDGYTVRDLKIVAGYCALEKGWKGDPRMEQHLCPETLYGPEKIAKYIDPARAWFSKLQPDEPQQTTPIDAELEPDWMSGGAA